MNTKRILFALAAFVVFLSLQSCNPQTKGEGAVVTDSRSTGEFAAIYSALDATVYYTQSPTYSVQLEGQKNILDLIQTRISGEELAIDYQRGARVGRHEPVTIRISGPRFKGMTISGSGSFHSTGAVAVAGNDVKLRISGSGSINLASLVCAGLTTEISGSGNIAVNGGSAATVSSSTSGSGSTHLAEAAASTGNVSISGSGDVKLWAANSLDVHISGSGSVFYRGHPAINMSVSGSGKVRQY